MQEYLATLPIRRQHKATPVTASRVVILRDCRKIVDGKGIANIRVDGNVVLWLAMHKIITKHLPIARYRDCIPGACVKAKGIKFLWNRTGARRQGETQLAIHSHHE